ncbi:hypothetical protein SCUCBS95973_002991 [Sporothrix curviconia]|uniref:Protein kinase domain-containing protein n=1 Tax=Sporothrix curviconia TaxID=1260050 RepID=A0ABP0BBN1_9PEZI
MDDIDGPKLAAFDFQGPQNIEFLEYLGEGLHAHVVRVRIKGQEYALKLFRFLSNVDWYGPGDLGMNNSVDRITALAHYSEPFYAECRAFGRLHETGHTDLALPCYGYILLDEEHEKKLHDKFVLRFNGSDEQPGDDEDDFRARYPGARSGRPPPIRGILKALGSCIPLDDDEVPNLSVRDAKRLLRETVQMQQLGIIDLDLRREQLIDGKFCDLSTAVTVPHFLTTPELNPLLEERSCAAMEYETFLHSINDYWMYSDMILSSCSKYRQQTSNLLDNATAFPRSVWVKR